MNNKPKAALCSERLPREAVEKLKTVCGRVFLLPSDRKLAGPVCHHPDMILTVVGNKLICDGDYFRANISYMKGTCEYLGLEPVTAEAPRGEKYPLDIGFNVLVTEKYLFGNLKYTAPEVLEAAKENGLEAVNVKQGYTACSSLLIMNTVVTADPSIFESAKSLLPAVKTESGKITLEPYDTGFIGGAAAYFGGTLYTIGELDGFPSFKAFLSEKNIDICPLTGGDLADYGGIKFF